MLALLAALLLAGCTWTGKGRDVAQALEKTAAYKTRAFSGSVGFKVAGDDSKSFSMTFAGASDNSDPANPMFTMTMVAEGQSSGVSMPGDGNMYLVTPQGTYGVPVPQAQRGSSALDSAAIYRALGKAIGHFAESQPMQNAQGKSVTTIAARVSRNKLCSAVLPAFGKAMSKMSAAGGGGSPLAGFSGGGSLEQVCKLMLAGDPQVWFGIDNGALTDVSLNANIALFGAGAMAVALQYHEYNQGQPQPAIKKPAGAQMLQSLTELQQLGAAGSR